MLQNKHFIFKEGIIDSEPEIVSVSKLYFRQTKRIEIEIGGPQYIKNKMAQIQALIEQSDSDVDEDGDLVDNLFSV